jgi:F420-dependent oxidoreductase-like protein
MDIALMIEGQDGLNWSRWMRIARAAEDLGFAGLYRSDHFVNAAPPDLDSLDLWMSLAWLASNTKRIEFGPLVSPVSFRNPVHTARMAAALDDLSGGRLQLGLGAGWNEREHRNFGFDLLDVKGRLQRFQDALEVVTKLLYSDQPVSFSGKYFELHDAILLPRPQRRVPIVIGGGKAILPTVAVYADEWNAVYQTPEKIAALNTRLDELLEKHNRRPNSVRRSLMSGVVFGRDDHEVKQKAAAKGQSVDQLREHGLFVGTGTQIADQIAPLAELGIQRVMLQWLDQDDMDGLEAMARQVIQ